MLPLMISSLLIHASPLRLEISRQLFEHNVQNLYFYLQAKIASILPSLEIFNILILLTWPQFLRFVYEFTKNLHFFSN